MTPIRVLALASYPIEAAATRLRLAQFIGPLRDRGIEVELQPFIDSLTFAGLYDRSRWWRTVSGVARGTGRRFLESAIARCDVFIVQREAAFLGPPLTEWLLHGVRRLPYILDLDDATWIQYDSPTYGRLTRFLKPSSKAGWLIRHADVAMCGSDVVAEYIGKFGTPAVHLPSAVDLDYFAPVSVKEKLGQEIPLVGWVGSHSTWQYLKPLLPILSQVAQSHPFRLQIVGHGGSAVTLPNIDLEVRDWCREREVSDFQSLDIGLYPIGYSTYGQGKASLKAIQYMSCGIPFVASPVGQMIRMGSVGTTHLLADSPDEWTDALCRLLTDPDLRTQMGRAGRAYAEAYFGLDRAADLLANSIYRAAGRSPDQL